MPRNERPLDPGDTPLLRFAADLRKLRDNAGSPVYRELSAKAHYSVAVLSEAAGGRKLPSLAVTLAYVDACGGDLTEWEQRWRAVAETQEGPATADDGQAPYPGLSAFQVEDADRFHGRGALMAHLSNHILNRRLVVVFGASGAGKSSLLRAGLAAASLRDGVDGLGPQRTLVCTPGAHPIDECALWLGDLVGVGVDELRPVLRADPTALHLRLRQALAEDDADRDALVIVDQFEEVFTLCADEDERLAFITALIHLATAPTSAVRLVLGVRADFFGHCLQYPQLRQVLGEGPVLVGAMTADELRQAITKPATDLGYIVETALVTRLVSEAINQPGVLPLMSHALLETWRRRQGVTLTAAGYDAVGGISHALSRTAESVYTGLAPEQQAVARQVFLRLTALGDGTEDTRRRVDRAELDHVPGLDEVLDALVAARLVTVDQDGVDIAHEALISHWPRLREWLTEDRDSLRAQRQLTEAAEIWDSLNRDDGALYRGARLDLARDWVTSCRPSLSHRERAFFDRSVEVCRQELMAAKRQARRLKQFIALLVVLLLALSGTTAYSLISQQTVARQRDDATIRNVIDQLPTLAVKNPELAGELTLAVYRLDPSPQTRGLVLSAGPGSRGNALTMSDPIGLPSSGEALSSDSTVFAYVENSHTRVGVARLESTGSQMSFVPPAGPDNGGLQPIDDIALSPDGRLLALARQGKLRQDTVELWDLGKPTAPARLRTYQADTGVHVAFSPDSRLLSITSSGATGGQLVDGKWVKDGIDLNTWLWDVTDPAATAPVAVLPDTNDATRFSADGKTLISGPIQPRSRGSSVGLPGPAKLWDVRQALSGAPPKALETTSFADAAVVVPSPDGQLLATYGIVVSDSRLSLWRRTGNTLAKVADLNTGVHPRSPAFSPDGKRLAWIEANNTVVVSDISDPTAPTLIATMAGTTNGAMLLNFTADGKLTVVESAAVLTRGLDPEAAAANICAALKKPFVPRSTWPAWNTFFPSMNVPEPCPS